MLLFYLHFFVIWTEKETKNGTVGQEAQVFSLGTTLSDDEFNFFFFWFQTFALKEQDFG